MNEYGVSVIDNFLGNEKGNQVLGEVTDMYSAGMFKVKSQNMFLSLLSLLFFVVLGWSTCR